MAYSRGKITEAIEKAVEQLGYSSLTSEQHSAVSQFLAGKDVFVSLPTGAGKSLCYLVLPLAFDYLRGTTRKSIIIVVSPLKSLMEDQVARFCSRGVMSVCVGIDSSVQVDQDVANGRYQVVFFSPEAMLTNLKWREVFRSETYQQNVVGLIVDEAHCVEKWGVEFRTEFSNISEVRSLIYRSRLMALTATATTRTRQLIISNLDMQGCHLVIRVPNKLNIKYHVYPSVSVEKMLEPIVSDVASRNIKADRVIIFCRTYNDTLEVFKALVCMLGQRDALYAPPSVNASNVEKSKLRVCEKYDGATCNENQEHIIKSFTEADGVVRVVVATIAFGMGLDSPNVQSVIHWGAPNDMDMYVQETGRGGRDGSLCRALLYCVKGTAFCSEMMKEYCKNTKRCRRELLMAAFIEKPSAKVDKPSPLHACCTVCEQNCECSDCKNISDIPPEAIADLLLPESLQCEPMPAKAALPSSQTKVKLYKQLVTYRSSISPPESSAALAMLGIELVTGLPNRILEDIVANYMRISTVDDLVNMGVSLDMASIILKLIQEIKMSE